MNTILFNSSDEIENSDVAFQSDFITPTLFIETDDNPKQIVEMTCKLARMSETLSNLIEGAYSTLCMIH